MSHLNYSPTPPMDTPIKNSTSTAHDIAHTKSICPWTIGKYDLFKTA